MLHAAALPLLLLHLTAQALASPVAASTLNISPTDSILADSNVASNQNLPSQNASTVTRHPVERSPLTLFIQTTPSEIITRTDLVTALYDSRAYIQEQIRKHGNSSLPDSDDPFNSTVAANLNCVLVTGTGPGAQQRLTYANLGDVVRGLMDTTFYPYKSSVNGLTFAIYHAVWGFIGTGALTTGAATKSA